MKVNKGQMIAFSEGEYSDYMVEALCVVDKPFDLDEMKAEWMNECCYEMEPNFYKHTAERRVKEGKLSFLAWLSMKMLVSDVNWIEVHTGCYGNAEISISECSNE